jgi:hypothetical protein
VLRSPHVSGRQIQAALQFTAINLTNRVAHYNFPTHIELHTLRHAADLHSPGRIYVLNVCGRKGVAASSGEAGRRVAAKELGSQRF